jgi:hypothetical protein
LSKFASGNSRYREFHRLVRVPISFSCFQLASRAA